MIITEATEDNSGICSFTHKLQYMFINKTRTRPIVNLNVLNLINWKVWYSSYKDFCCHYDNSAFKTSTLTVPCSSVISSHTTCVPHPSHLFKRVMVKWNALDTVQSSHTYEMNWTLRVNHTQARIRSPNAGVPKFGPGGPVSLQNLAPTLIKHTWNT